VIKPVTVFHLFITSKPLSLYICTFMVYMVSDLSPSEQHATPPSWSHLDNILRDRLGWLHHSLGCDSLPAAEAAVQFSNVVSDLLMEFRLIKSSYCSGRHLV